MKRSTFEGFCLKNADKVPLTEYVYVNIKIEGLYEWGVGFVSNEAIRTFHTEVYNALKDKGFSILSSDYRAFADTLIQDNTKLNLCMHPMEFTGMALREQADMIIEALNSCGCISYAGIEEPPIPLHTISDNDYRNLIYDDAENIVHALLDYRIDIHENWDADFDFVKNARIYRVESSPKMYSSDCIDASAVSDIRRACIDLLDKGETSHDKIAAEIALQTQVWRKEIELIQKEIQSCTKEMSPMDLKKFYGDILGYNRVQNNELEKYMKKFPVTEYRHYIRIAENNGFLDQIKEQAAAEIKRSERPCKKKYVPEIETR